MQHYTGFPLSLYGRIEIACFKPASQGAGRRVLRRGLQKAAAPELPAMRILYVVVMIPSTVCFADSCTVASGLLGMAHHAQDLAVRTSWLAPEGIGDDVIVGELR